jgi:hypothetical protein
MIALLAVASLAILPPEGSPLNYTAQTPAAILIVSPEFFLTGITF